jgi:hypothetical protein
VTDEVQHGLGRLALRWLSRRPDAKPSEPSTQTSTSTPYVGARSNAQPLLVFPTPERVVGQGFRKPVRPR